MTSIETPTPSSLGNGIHLIPAPLPFKSPAWVNTYAIETPDGYLLIDCGTDWEPGHRSLKEGFDDLGLDMTAVHTLLVSHLHPDHVGMSARLVRELGCRFVMHESASRLVDLYNDTPGYYQRLDTLARTHGVPANVLNVADAPPRADFMPLIDPPDHTVSDGDTIDLGGGRSLLVVHTPGHDQAHICLRDSLSGVFFSGDHVLPRISPVIMYDFEGADALGDYLAALGRLIDLGLGLTYPAHGTVMNRGDERARQLLLHHDRRLLDMARRVRQGPTTAWDIMIRSFRPNLDPVETRLAFLETVAHLEHLRLGDRIRIEDRDGNTFYTP